ncbi:hypothetical protein COTS27_00905 [Spirochaetota bacterium]|nr:hypothetical protein COTS27_00905 [Spirochaetota bacterium]
MKSKNIIESSIFPKNNNKDDNIDLNVCIQYLSSLQKVFKKTAKKIYSNFPKKTTEKNFSNDPVFKIVHANKRSPFNILLNVLWIDDERSKLLIEDTKNNLMSISSKKESKIDLEYDILESYKKLSHLSKGKDDRYNAVIKFPDNKEVNIDENFVKNIDKLLKGSDSCITSYEGCITSYEGELEQINLHDDINYFYIYPYSLPEKIRCVFPKELRNLVIKGIGRKVCVTGEAIYSKNQNFPCLIKAKEIDIYPSETDLPDWDNLFGIAPNATGELQSEDFVRRLRNEWDEKNSIF